MATETTTTYVSKDQAMELLSSAGCHVVREDGMPIVYVTRGKDDPGLRDKVGTFLRSKGYNASFGVRIKVSSDPNLWDPAIPGIE